MILDNENNRIDVSDTDPGIPLRDSNSPHSRTLEYITAWVIFLSLHCKRSICTAGVVEAVFSTRAFPRESDVELKHIEFWGLTCFVVRLHWFILAHVLEPSEGNMCALRFFLPSDPITSTTTLHTALFNSASGIACDFSNTFTPENMRNAEGVVDRHTVDDLKRFACCYCRLTGCAGGATWDETRTYFRSVMVPSTPLDPEDVGDAARVAHMAVAMAVLRGESE
jgi:hypothetical protein